MIAYTEIEEYINRLRIDELNAQGVTKIKVSSSVFNNNKLCTPIKSVRFILLALLDYVSLRLALLRVENRRKRMVFTAYNFTNNVNGELEDRIVKPLFTDNILFINQSKEIRLKKINDQKVYNIGGITRLLHLLFRRDTEMMSYFKAYQLVNDSLLKHVKKLEIYLLWFYDLNSLSIIFSRYRERHTLIEVQHGTIINYPPYIKPSPVRIAEIFYVKNQATVDYLKNHLCRDFECEYRLIPYPNRISRPVEGIHILYASFADYKGAHPVFLNFLRTTKIKNLDIQVRLHPRERSPETEAVFTEQISQFGREFRFDRSKNWLEENTISNLIVISPFSSSIEDAYDNGYQTIIIDPAGQQRFNYLIDNKRCFYSQDLEETISRIIKV